MRRPSETPPAHTRNILPKKKKRKKRRIFGLTPGNAAAEPHQKATRKRDRGGKGSRRRTGVLREKGAGVQEAEESNCLGGIELRRNKRGNCRRSI